MKLYTCIRIYKNFHTKHSVFTVPDMHAYRERQTDRNRQTELERDRQTDIDRQTETDRQRQTDRDRD